MKKKLLSLILSLVFVLSCFTLAPASVQAKNYTLKGTVTVWNNTSTDKTVSLSVPGIGSKQQTVRRGQKLRIEGKCTSKNTSVSKNYTIKVKVNGKWKTKTGTVKFKTNGGYSVRYTSEF